MIISAKHFSDKLVWLEGTSNKLRWKVINLSEILVCQTGEIGVLCS